MHPLLKQCYEAADRRYAQLATVIQGRRRSGRCASPLRTQSISSLLIPHLNKLKRMFSTARVSGCPARQQQGNRRIPEEGRSRARHRRWRLTAEWDRLDSWPLFTEGFQLVVNRCHPLADEEHIPFEALKKQQLLSRGYCEYAERLDAVLRAGDIAVDGSHDVSCENDLIKLLEADISIAIMPRSAARRRRCGVPRSTGSTSSAPFSSMASPGAKRDRGRLRRDEDAAQRRLAGLHLPAGRAAERHQALPLRHRRLTTENNNGRKPLPNFWKRPPSRAG